MNNEVFNLLMAFACMGLGCFGLGFCLAWWLFREGPLTQSPQYPVSDQIEYVGGWNRDNGSVWCVLCDWKGNARSIEHMEAIITDHMRIHGLFPISRTDLATGERTEFPKEK